MTVPLSLRFLSGQSGHMSGHGLTLEFVSSEGPEQTEFMDREGVAVFTVPMSRTITPVQDLLSVARLWRLIRRLRPVIVHAHTPKGGLLGMLAAWLAGTPVRVYHLRGLPLQSARGWRRVLLKGTERISCGLAHRVISVSHKLRQLVVAEGICPAAKVTTLLGGSGNGVDSEGEFKPSAESAREGRELRARLGVPGDALTVGFVGRLVGDKGVIELAEAWAQVRERHGQAHLLLAGPEETRDAVPASLLASLRADPRVHLLGRIPWPRPVYAASDLIVLPSHREGFPNVPLEAAAMGLPVVATRIDGCDEAVVDGTTGTLVRVKDATALCQAMLAYLDDAGLRQAHGQAAQDRVRQSFRREAIWEALWLEYRDLLSGRDLAPGTPL